MSLLIDLKSCKLPISVGKKALNLRRLQGFACDWKAYHRYIINDMSLVDELRLEPSRKLNPHKYYPVRSSGNIEDSFDRSFARQFKSVLNVRGVDDILQASVRYGHHGNPTETECP